MYNSLKEYPKKIRLLLNTTENIFDAIQFYLGFKDSTIVKLKYNLGYFKVSQPKYLLGRNLEVINYLIKNEKTEDIPKFLDFLKQLSNKVIIIDDVKFYNTEYNSILWEYFMENSFILNDIDNRTVIDVGANIGDTALFLASNGAKVIAFEPVPEIYEIALSNIELNKELKDKICLYNYAVDGEDGEIEIFLESKEECGGANSFVKKGKKTIIQSLSIETILKKYNIKPDILKLDCEGAEYSILEHSDLSMFNYIMIEYHEKITGLPPKLLCEKLDEMGFDYYFEKTFDLNPNEIGLIFAEKKSKKIM